MSTVTSLLARGYFPKELPPAFTTDDFARFCGGAVPANFELDVSSHKSLRRNLVTSPALHNLARSGTLRRELQIPNPISQYQVFSVLAKHWKQIRRHCSAATLSLTAPRYRKPTARAISPKHAFDILPVARAKARAGCRYVLSADLSQFYPSVYTHAIPWALHGKKVSKARFSDFSLLGNLLDLAVRNGQDRQTRGIPIGPDSSLVLAEVLLTIVDKEMAEFVSATSFRYIDDFEAAFDTAAEAERALCVLQAATKRLELQLNPRKTRIIELPVPLEQFWTPHLRLFPFRSHPRSQQTDFIGFFGRAFELAAQNREEAILSYAVQRIRSTKIHSSNWPLCEDLLLQCATIEPGTLRYVLRQLWDNALVQEVNVRKLNVVLSGAIKVHSAQQHGSEVAWALWGVLAFRCMIPEHIAEDAMRTDDSVVALLLLHCRELGLIAGNPNFAPLEACMTSGQLVGGHWLLAYEANLKGWLPSHGGVDHVANNPYFSALKASGVSFYRTDIAFPPKKFRSGLTLASEFVPTYSGSDDVELDFDEEDEPEIESSYV